MKSSVEKRSGEERNFPYGELYSFFYEDDGTQECILLKTEDGHYVTIHIADDVRSGDVIGGVWESRVVEENKLTKRFNGTIKLKS